MIPKIWPRPDFEDTTRATCVRNVVGKPKVVEMEVNDYLAKGFDVGGPMLPYNDPNRGQGIFVQQVILYAQEDSNVTDTTIRRPS